MVFSIMMDKLFHNVSITRAASIKNLQKELPLEQLNTLPFDNLLYCKKVAKILYSEYARNKRGTFGFTILRCYIEVFLHLPKNFAKLRVGEWGCATTAPAPTENCLSKQEHHPRQPQVLSRQCMLPATMKEWPEEALQHLTSVLPAQHTEDVLL